MRSLFITGASGLVGTAILEQLDADQFDRISLLARGDIRLPTHLVGHDRVEQIRSGLSRPERYAGSIDPSTAIIHLAARTGRARREDYVRDNVEGTRAITHAAESQEAAGLVNVSSIAVKFPETAYYPYADSKRAAEGIVATCIQPWITVRPTMVLGPTSPIWRKLRQLGRGPFPVVPGSPSTRIQPIHVDDLATMLIDIAVTASFDRGAFDIGGADPVTVEDFVKRVHERLVGRRGVAIPVPVALGMPLLRAIERISPVPLPVTEGQLSTFLYDGVVDPNPVQERYADRLRGVDQILDALLKPS